MFNFEVLSDILMNKNIFVALFVLFSFVFGYTSTVAATTHQPIPAQQKVKKEFKKELKTKKQKKLQGTGTTVLLVILALFIPPLAVFIATKSGKKTLIDFLLCLLFWIPGVIYALIQIFKE